MAELTLTQEKDFLHKVEQELTGNILPFWMKYAVDEKNGGFYGSLSNDLVVDNEVPRSAVLCARVLWTYSKAFRFSGEPEYLKMAEHAYQYLTQVFWDSEYGGVFWTVDKLGRPVMDRKHSYAQAFAIYGLTEHFLAFHKPESLDLACRLFALLEKHAYDPENSGYVESCGRDWLALADTRLSAKEPDCQKSMNTLLHIMEAYTNLLRAWNDPFLRLRQSELIGVFLDHVIDPNTNHFRLFFDNQWNSLVEKVSYGHDIEGSWLLVEAADVLGNELLIARVKQVSVQMAQAVLREGINPLDGSVTDERVPGNEDHPEKSWWCQAEGVVGFYNAFQISESPYFFDAVLRLWTVIETQYVDREHGEWFKLIDPQGKPILSAYKIGPWECPYHHARACFEIIERLGSAHSAG